MKFLEYCFVHGISDNILIIRKTKAYNVTEILLRKR